MGGNGARSPDLPGGYGLRRGVVTVPGGRSAFGVSPSVGWSIPGVCWTAESDRNKAEPPAPYLGFDPQRERTTTTPRGERVPGGA